MILRWLRRDGGGPSPRRVAAVREAGHALVAQLHGLRVCEIRLEPDADEHVLLDGLRYAVDAPALRHDPQGHFVAILVKAEVAVAGRVATRLLLDVDADGPGDAVAETIAARLGPSERQREALLALATARAHDLLAEERHRTALTDLAARLEDEGMLDRDVLETVLLSGVRLSL